MQYHILLGFGAILLASLVAEWVGRRTHLPRVTLLVLTGVLFGPHGADWIPYAFLDASELIATFALAMVAFLLGSELSVAKLRRHGRQVMAFSLAIVAVTWLIVGVGLSLIGVPVVLAILLAATATATDPAATRDVLIETGAKGPFRDLLSGTVAIDDAWGLIIFGLAMAMAGAIQGDGAGSAGGFLLTHLGGAVAIGVATGVPMALLSGRIRPGHPSQVEAIGVVLLCSGLAGWLGASHLLAATISGTIVANVARHHRYAFREIEHFEWPFLTIFFVMAGAMLDVPMVMAGGAVVLAYVLLRFAGRICGGFLGALLGGLPARRGGWLGAALMPQAGVAIGMALLGAAEFPEFGTLILAVTIGATAVFEMLGPILTRIAIEREQRRATGDQTRTTPPPVPDEGPEGG